MGEMVPKKEEEKTDVEVAVPPPPPAALLEDWQLLRVHCEEWLEKVEVAGGQGVPVAVPHVLEPVPPSPRPGIGVTMRVAVPAPGDRAAVVMHR